MSELYFIYKLSILVVVTLIFNMKEIKANFLPGMNKMVS